MTIVAFIVGLTLPTLSGWLLLRLLQGKKRVLFHGEEWAMAAVTGLLFTMLLTFSAHAYGSVPLTLIGMGRVQLLTLCVLGGLWFFRCLRNVPAPTLPTSNPLSRWIKAVFIFFGLWITIKTIIASVTFLLLTPTYLDDTLDNWNLRAKVFFFDEALTLVMPNEDPVTSPMGVSSYSPAVPLMKTWMSTIAGTWSEPLINSIHIVWYVAALTLLYYVLRRLMTTGWSLLGTTILASMPLYLMHGTNPYADAFVSVHVFIAFSLVLCMFRETDPASRASFMRLGAVAAGLLPFTKNEGMLVYLPPLLLLLVLGLAWQWRKQQLSTREVLITLAWYIGPIVLLTLPWLSFKWLNGLTFGNAKPVTSLGIGWQDGVVISIVVNTFFEGNWLMLFPLLIALLVLRWRAAFSSYFLITAYVLIVLLGQWTLYLFTGLAAEARMQTGLARGIVQLMPVIVLLTSVLLWDSRISLQEAAKALARKRELPSE